MNCYISRNYRSMKSAGSKAKTDIERIMEDMGFRNVGLSQTSCHNRLLHFLLNLSGVLKAPFCLHRGDTLVLQYPLKKYYNFVCNMAHCRGAKVVTVIHDLGSFRRKALTVAEETDRLNHSDYVIAHNRHMEAWLRDNGCRTRLGSLGIFDYLSDTSANGKTSPAEPWTVVYAGGLSHRKNSFLYEWGAGISEYRVRLYGNGFSKETAKGSDKFDEMGFVRSDELIETAEGHFGLVWDGTSTDACEGDFGEYLRYNNPHKTSLYIRCHLPVIIWRHAALADFVQQHGIGICVDSLSELDTVLSALTSEQYAGMRKNVIAMDRLVSTGHFFRTAVSEAIRSLG